jgi:hypothetical protein
LPVRNFLRNRFVGLGGEWGLGKKFVDDRAQLVCDDVVEGDGRLFAVVQI